MELKSTPDKPYKIIGPTEDEIEQANSKEYASRGAGKILRRLIASHVLRIALAVVFTGLGTFITYQGIFRGR